MISLLADAGRIIERHAGLILAALIALYLLPLLFITVPATVDGPIHLSIAHTLITYDRPEGALLRQIYELNLTPEPNWGSQLLIAALLEVLAPFTAEKVVFGLFIVGLPLAARYALRGIAPAAGWLALLFVPFCYTKLFLGGFYNFAFSLIPFLIALGYFLRHEERFTAVQTAVFAVMGLWLYFSHAMSTAMLGVALATLVVSRMALELGEGGASPLSVLRIAWRRTWPPLVALLPTLVLFLLFLLRHTGESSRYGVPALDRLKRLAIFGSLVSHQPAEVLFTLPYLALFAIITFLALRQRLRERRATARDGLFLLALVAFALVFALPDYSSGGSAHSQRAEIYPFFALILWFAAIDHPPLRKAFLATVAIVVSVGLLTLDFTRFLAIEPHIAELYSAAPYLKPSRTLLPIVFDRYGRDTDGAALSRRIEIFYLAAERFNPLAGVVGLMNNQAATSVFLVRYRPEYAAWTLLRDNQLWDKLARSVLADPSRIPLRPDYVLLYGYDAARIRADPTFAGYDPEAVLSRLATAYDLILTSAPSGAVRLYRRHDLKD